jgi:hypothetical protein
MIMIVAELGVVVVITAAAQCQVGRQFHRYSC